MLVFKRWAQTLHFEGLSLSRRVMENLLVLLIMSPKHSGLNVHVTVH